MEIYSAKAFDDIVPDNSFTLLDQFPNYTANIAVAYKDVNLLESEITDGIINSNYKEITAVISGQGVDDILTYTTLRSDCNEEGPILTSISTDYLSDLNSVPRFASSPNEVIIKLHFNSAIDVSNPQNIVLDLNVTERTEGDDEYYDVLETPASTITVTGGILDDETLSFTYGVNPNHTSWTLTEYLDVLAITLNGAKITGLVGGMSDGCHADISLPTEEDSTLAANEVIIRIVPGFFYIFTDWTDLQNAINPVTEGSGLTAPTFGDIFDKWKRFDGTTVFADKAAAVLAENQNSMAWKPQYIDGDGDPTVYSQTMQGVYDTFSHFYMQRNVVPANGFISPESYETFSLEVTLHSTSSDDDMIGIIVAYEEGSNKCNGGNHNSHVATECATTGSTPYVLYAGRSTQGSEPKMGWGLVYNKGNTVAYYNHSEEATNEDGGNGSGDKWNIRETTPPNSRTASQNWSSYYVRVKVERNLNNIKIYTTDFFNTRAKALTAGNLGVRNDGTGYFDGNNILEVDLEDDVRLHKFIGGSPFGYITFSQPNASYLDNVIPEPEVEEEAHADYVVYFDDRQSSGGGGVYDGWGEFNLVQSTCCQPDVSNPRSYNPSGSGIWKWNAPAGDYRFVPGLTIQDLNGYYGIVKPMADGVSDPVEEGGQTIKYSIKKVAEN
ncbi:MAG: hypothetical protein QF856_02500, partial [Candidatus Marinimicrobia bacterium]|nr:hypothetical protein [Candidatus Neomarinimicrobiota bacterium]